MSGHKHSGSVSQNQKAILANAYNELGKELSSTKIRVVGNYTLGKVIGEGAYGKVRMGTHRLTSTRVAIKQIPKSMSASLTREIHHHRQLHHPHVTQMYEVIATEQAIWIVTELCSGGELFDYLVEKGRLSEDETRVIFGQLCLAVAYLHDKGIVHRDLKLENVLLDERCRVKLGDFGFTREFERGALMETFCGTTGYASPEMLQGRKYQGPEVDVWSLGIILYCLLTGTLPFDDDDESVMRSKIIQGDFEDPEWLSPESRDLIKNILQHDTAKRITIPQIIGHPWFTSHGHPPQSTPASAVESSSSSSADTDAFTSESTTTAATTMENDPFFDDIHNGRNHTNASQTTLAGKSNSTNSINKTPAPPELHSVRTPARTKRRSISSQLEDDSEDPSTSASQKIFDVNTNTSNPNFASTSTSNLNTNTTMETHPNNNSFDFASLLSTPAPIIFSTPLERELLNTLSLLGFDTAQIVHSVLCDACDAAGAVWWMLVKKGADAGMLDTGIGRIGGSVHANANANRKTVGVGVQTDTASHPHPHHHQLHSTSSFSLPTSTTMTSLPQLSFVPPTPTTATLVRPITPPPSNGGKRALSPSLRSMGAESPGPNTPGSASGNGSLRLTENGHGSKGRKTRSGSVSIMQRATTALEAAGLVRKKSSEAVRERERLEEVFNQEKEKEKEREREREKTGEKDGEREQQPRASGSSGSGSGSVGHSKLTKSPPLRPVGFKEKEREKEKDRDYVPPPATPPPIDGHLSSQQGLGLGASPWVLTSRDSAPAAHSHSHSGSPENSATGVDRNVLLSTSSTPNVPLAATGKANASGGQQPHRNRANLLTAFRLWFHEDRKGKRKESAAPASVGAYGNRANPSHGGNTNASVPVKRRTSGGSNGGGRFPYRKGHRAQRASVSSRRSSSVNSRRSSGASFQMQQQPQQFVLDSPQTQQQRRAGGGGGTTPNSERGDYSVSISSRPSSVRSFSMQRGGGGGQGYHRKSPSASSTGSFRATSPSSASAVQRYHRRNGSGGSSGTTRVVRQIQPTSSRPPHVRSNSTASSVPSPVSSRPTSFYEPSESEGGGGGGGGRGRAGSPLKSRRPSSADDSTPRRNPLGATGATTFIAQKRSGPFMSPVGHGFGNSVGRSSWKKSWGLEPPGWQTRTTHLPIEVLAISPPTDGGVAMSIRDVFSGRQSLSLGDESDWVDEDDDVPAFAGGLGQLATSVSPPSGSSAAFGINAPAPQLKAEPVVTLSPAPRGHRAKRGRSSTTGLSNTTAALASRGRGGHSPVGRSSPLPVDTVYETSGGRRPLPAGRSGHAFRHAIQEEDEGEEEE